MKGMIAENGYLKIKRGSNMRKQFCSKIVGSIRMIDCGDSCPLFGEPFVDDVKETISLTICENRKLVFDNDFLDKRP